MDRPRDCPLWAVGPWTSACLAERRVQSLRKKRASGGLTARSRTDREDGYKEACDWEKLVGRVQCRPCLHQAAECRVAFQPSQPLTS